MTKKIYVINADSSDYRVRITVQEKSVQYDPLGNELKNQPAIWQNTEGPISLDNPGDLFVQHIYSGRRLIIEEYSDA